MISFVSLFLGLIIGPHAVELAVGPEVAEVRLSLDDAPVGTLVEEPWKMEIDFGDRLTPHQLVATAYDAEGEEVGHARQWVNLPRGRAESVLVLEPTEEDGTRFARLFWKNLEDAPPLATRVLLDGKALPAVEDGRYRLPEVDPAQVHVLSAEIDFDDGTTARAEQVFGGELGDRLDVDITAVPMRWRREPGALSVTALRGSLRSQDGPLPLVALEQGRSQVVAVVERSAVWMLRRHALALDSGTSAGERRRLLLKPGEGVRLQTAVATRRTGGDNPLDLFPITPEHGARQGDLAFLLSHAPFVDEGSQQISDAVAVAAVEAAAGNRPRAVVLILGDRWQDRSRFKPEAVRAYLEELRVPLIVWFTGPPRSGVMAEDRMPLARKTKWGQARDISSLTRYLEAVFQLREELDRQMVAWVRGAYLPREITLTATGTPVELAN